MGARNVAAVFARWKHLDDAPFRALVFMALTTLDSDEEPRYWGGWEALAEALGRNLASGSEESHRQAVKRVVRVLRAKGALTNVISASPGRRAEYALDFFGTGVSQRPVNDSESGTRSGTGSDSERGSLSDPNVGHSPSERGSLSVRSGVAHRPAKEGQDQPGSTSGVITHPPTLTAGGPWPDVAGMTGADRARAALNEPDAFAKLFRATIEPEDEDWPGTGRRVVLDPMGSSATTPAVVGRVV